MEELLKPLEIERELTTKYIGRKIVSLEETASTNDDAKKAGENGEVEGTVFIAEKQTSGRGRMYREWKTAPGESIAMTILVRPKILPNDAPTITPIIALSIVEALKSITKAEVKIKWPNDIFIEDKKIGGILTEMNAGMDTVSYIVIGIGLNINQTEMEEELKNIGTSLKIYTGENFSREKIIAKLLNRFEENYEAFNEYGLIHFGQRLKENSAILGKEVIVISGLEMVEGVAADIDETGNLMLRLEDGRIKRIIYGDVSLKCKDLLKG